MQNNTIAFTILKFPVLVRVHRNFTTVYSIFFFLHFLPKLGVDIVILLISFLLLSHLPCFNPLYFFKGHLFWFISVLSDTDIGFSLVQFHRPKEWSALHRKSLLFAKESRIYHHVPHC